MLNFIKIPERKNFFDYQIPSSFSLMTLCTIVRQYGKYLNTHDYSYLVYLNSE